MNNQIKATIVSQKQVANKTVEVTLNILDKGLAFKAGQYIKVFVPGLETSNESSKRELSIASNPTNPNSIAVTYRQTDSGFKNILSSMPHGSELNIDGPYGIFTLPEDTSKSIVFICGGVGVTPCLSMIRYATSENLPTKIFLLYANRKPEDSAYIEELDLLAGQNDNFTYQAIFGTIRPDIISSTVANHVDDLFYISGLPKMVSAVRSMVIGNNIAENRVRIEEFTGYSTAAAENYLRIKNDNNVDTTDIKDAITTDSILWALNKFVIVSTTDVDGNITYANDKFIETSKYSREELIGQNHRILKSGFHPQELYDDMWRNYLTKGKVWVGDIKNQAKDGTPYWVHATIVPTFSTTGKITGYIGIRFLITERKDAEDKLALASDLLKQTLHAWFMVDMTGYFVDANAALLNLLGYTLDELKKLTYSDILMAHTSNVTNLDIKQTIINSSYAEGETIGIKKDGSRFDVAYSINVYAKDDKPIYWYGFLSDISQRKLYEHELEQINQSMIGRELKMIELKQQIAELTKPIKLDAEDDNTQ